MRWILMGFGAIPAQRSTIAVRAVYSWMSPRRTEALSLVACKNSVYNPQNWTRVSGLKGSAMANPWLLVFLCPHFQLHMYRQLASRQVRPRSFQAAKKSVARCISKGRKVQEFKTLQSSDLKYIEWWRVKVSASPPELRPNAANGRTYLHCEIVSCMLIVLH